MDSVYLCAPVVTWRTDAEMPALIERARALRRCGLRFSAEDVGGEDRLRRIYAALETPTTNRKIERARKRARGRVRL